MTDKDNDNLDPLRLMRDWFIQSEKMWSDAMTGILADEGVAKNSGRFMQEALHTQRMFSESMGQYLASMNMPSRSDILDMKDRISRIEETLNTVLVELRTQGKQQAAGDNTAATKKRPARTRKAPSKSE